MYLTFCTLSFPTRRPSDLPPETYPRIGPELSSPAFSLQMGRRPWREASWLRPGVPGHPQETRQGRAPMRAAAAYPRTCRPTSTGETRPVVSTAVARLTPHASRGCVPAVHPGPSRLPDDYHP